MAFVLSFSYVRAFALGLALISLAPAHAQKTTVKTKTSKVKTKTSAALTPPVSEPKEVAAAAVPMEPIPKSPGVSAPQVVKPELPAEWISDLGAAQAQAKATNRPIVAVFSGSDWCKPCIIYEQEVFAKPEFMAYAKDKLVLAHFDFPRLKKNQPTAAQLKLNEAAAAQLNKEGDFPLAVVIAPDGKVLAKTGYIAGGPAAFEAYLKKVVPTL
ncbi:thioredoxin family protein [Hymenobacter negativus]|uniref:Thioredoxin family protein n=1 Tax=Hymenobacter negativus TaxID=2795026 RepID=A0ABS0Q6A7_9BACT|nr:thioredoxin family protein [Hymenobacter negativus]MBH8558196.1 thioredoxin family protein [Hymenobacter negativus]